MSKSKTTVRDNFTHSIIVVVTVAVLCVNCSKCVSREPFRTYITIKHVLQRSINICRMKNGHGTSLPFHTQHMEQGFSLLQRTTLLPPILLCVALFSYLYTILWLKPERLRHKLRSQGVKGPDPSFLFGNIPEMRRIKKELAKSDDHEMGAGTSDPFSSNYLGTIFPYFLHWSRVSGMSSANLCLTVPGRSEFHLNAVRY
jgi:hypothetical protein